MSSKKQKLGSQGEAIACEYLIKKQYKILAQNWHSRLGEVDIIAQRNGNLVFVEVKTRQTYSNGSGIEAVTRRKLRRISMAGLDFIRKRCPGCPGFCIEVVEIRFHQNKVRIRHYRDIQI